MTDPRPYPDSPQVPPQVPLPPAAPTPRAANGNGPLPAAKPNPQVQTSSKEAPLATVLLEKSPPWLVSMVFHMLLLIVMGLLIISQTTRTPVKLSAEVASSDSNLPEPVDTSSDPGFSDGKAEGTSDILSSSDLPVVDRPLASYGDPSKRLGGHAMTGGTEAPGLSWIGNRGDQWGRPKDAARIGNGGSDITQLAVLRGLDWLARNQQRDGSWSLSGPYSDGVFKEWDNPAAAAAMALLAFQGDGNTDTLGKYKKNVALGWKWLLKEQDEHGCFFHYGNYTHRFYTQGMCTIALCELFGMTKDSRYRAPAQLAVDYCLRTQSPQGGWRYNPNSESDVSVTGWIVMALKSAKMAGLNVPDEAFQKVGKFLDTAADQDGPGYRYQPEAGESVRLSMTAEALLMREYLGWKHDNPKLAAGIEMITTPANLIDYKHGRNVYYWYYATQASFHFGGAPWNRWNEVMKKVLPSEQIPRGKEGGSWNPRGSGGQEDDQFAGSGGRLYVTCLSIYMLEVYYRHMPLYRDVRLAP